VAKVLRFKAAVVILAAASRLASASPDAGIHIPLTTTKVTLDPTAVQDSQSLMVARQLHCQLLRMRGQEAVPEAAETITFVTPTLIRMTLREGLRFTNGDPVRSEDVVATFELLRSSRQILRNVFAWIAKFEAVDEKTIQFHLRKPIPSPLKFLGAPNFALLSKKFIRLAAGHPELWNNPVGCGKYRVAQWDESAGLIELRPVSEGRTLFFHFGVTPAMVARQPHRFDILDAPYVDASVDSGRFREERSFDPKQLFLGLNTTLPAWRNQADRCRFLKSIDRQKIVAKYGSGAEVPASFFPRGVIGYAPDWPAMGPAPRPQPLGRPFRLSFLGLSVSEDRRAIYTSALEPAAGRVTSLVIRNPAHFGEDYLKSGADAIIVGFKSNYLDGYEFLMMFAEPPADMTGYKGDDLQRRVIASQEITDPGQRAQAYREIARVISERCLVLPLVSIPSPRALIRADLTTPGFGEGPINEYDLSAVR
jgi:hypothetical protein